MSFAPRHDYPQYEQAVSGPRLERMREMTVEEKFDSYADFFDTIREAADSIATNESQNLGLREKMAIRKRLLRAFRTKEH